MLKGKTMTKTALVLSLLLIALWVILGANASIAWYKQDDTIVNSLNFGEFDVELYHKVGSEYKPVDSTTKVFDDAALYEPGYTQIVYLKIENKGTIDFNYNMSIVPDLANMVVGTSVLGGAIRLPEYLRFGLVYDETEDGLLEKTANRQLAQEYATTQLSRYDDTEKMLAAGASNYCALILYMPEQVGNEANYRGNIVPSVDVGIGVTANQID